MLTGADWTHCQAIQLLLLRRHRLLLPPLLLRRRLLLPPLLLRRRLLLRRTLLLLRCTLLLLCRLEHAQPMECGETSCATLELKPTPAEGVRLDARLQGHCVLGLSQLLVQDAVAVLLLLDHVQKTCIIIIIIINIVMIKLVVANINEHTALNSMHDINGCSFSWLPEPDVQPFAAIQSNTSRMTSVTCDGHPLLLHKAPIHHEKVKAYP